MTSIFPPRDPKKTLSPGRSLAYLGLILLMVLGFIAGIIALVKWAGQ